MNNANAGLSAESVEPAAKAYAERATIRQETQKAKSSTFFRKRTFARLRATVQSLLTNIESLFSEKEILQKARNNTQLMSIGVKAQEALCDAPNSNLAQKFADDQKCGTTIRRSLQQRRSGLSFDTE